MATGLPLPTVALAPVTDDEDEEDEEEEASRKLRIMLAWLVGLEGGGVPRDVFRVVLGLLMPFWDPSRRTMRGGGGGGGGQRRLG